MLVWWRQVLWWELAAAAQGRQAQTAGHWVQRRWSELVMVMHLSTAQGRREDVGASAASNLCQCCFGSYVSM